MSDKNLDIKIFIDGQGISTENFGDADIEIHSEYEPFCLDFKLNYYQPISDLLLDFIVKYKDKIVFDSLDRDIKDIKINYNKIGNKYQYHVDYMVKYDSNIYKNIEYFRKEMFNES